MLLREHPPTLIAKRIRPEAATSLRAAVAIVIISGVPRLCLGEMPQSATARVSAGEDQSYPF
jgi:hypothetical protein